VPVKRSKERLRGIHSKDTTSHSDTSPIIVYIIVCEVGLDPPPPPFPRYMKRNFSREEAVWI
jgi:hypothetical protein